MHLKDRVALVTGAGSGIGEASAKLLASHGARVGVLSRTAEEVREVAERIKNDGGEAVALTADISKPPQIKKAIDRLADRWGRLDIVFANAGINGVWAPIEELEPDEWDKTLEVNLKGTFLTIKYSVPLLRKQGGHTWLRFVLFEGRNRQIRKMCAQVGLNIISLTRIAIDNLQLPDDLAPGEWRDLSGREVKALMTTQDT